MTLESENTSEEKIIPHKNKTLMGVFSFKNLLFKKFFFEL
jgi:hypothetical protein